jgi:hypothetical protein
LFGFPLGLFLRGFPPGLFLCGLAGPVLRPPPGLLLFRFVVGPLFGGVPMWAIFDVEDASIGGAWTRHRVPHGQVVAGVDGFSGPVVAASSG